MPYQLGGAPPGLRGFLMSRQNQMADQQMQMQAAQQALGLQGLLMKKQMAPLEMELLRAKIAESQAMSQSAPVRAQMEMELKRAQLEKAQREGRQADIAGQARMGLAGLLGGNFAPNLTGVMTDENQAREAAIAADRAGQKVNIGVPNPSNVQALSILADPTGRLMRNMTTAQKPSAQTNLAKLISERDVLPPNDPRRQLYDKAIEKASTHQAPVNVYSGSLTAGVDAQGNPVFVQPSGREGVPPRVVEGVRPMPKPADERAAQAEREAEATVESVRQRIASLSQLIQQNPSAVGIPGMVRRGVEAASGVVEGMGGPGIPTPAIDFANQQALLLADVRKLVEKDPNLSNQERETLKTTLGGGTFQTPSSAIRAMNNVLEYVERKKLTGRNREARRDYSQEDLEFTARKHGITVDEVKRRLGR